MKNKIEAMWILAGLYIGIELLYAAFMGSIAALMIDIIIFCGLINALTAAKDREVESARKEA